MSRVRHPPGEPDIGMGLVLGRFFAAVLIGCIAIFST